MVSDVRLLASPAPKRPRRGRPRCPNMRHQQKIDGQRGDSDDYAPKRTFHRAQKMPEPIEPHIGQQCPLQAPQKHLSLACKDRILPQCQKDRGCVPQGNPYWHAKTGRDPHSLTGLCALFPSPNTCSALARGQSSGKSQSPAQSRKFEKHYTDSSPAHPQQPRQNTDGRSEKDCLPQSETMPDCQ